MNCDLGEINQERAAPGPPEHCCELGVFPSCLAHRSVRVWVPDLAVRRLPGDRHLLARGARVPQGHAVHLPRGHRPRHQQEQQEAGRGLDGRVQGLLLYHIPR